MLPDKIYNVLKWLALVAIDAVGVAYQALALVWGFPYGNEVLTSCTVISTLLGTLIGISAAAYKKQVKADD